MKPERDGARPGLENFQQKIIVAHIDLNAKHTICLACSHLVNKRTS